MIAQFSGHFPYVGPYKAFSHGRYSRKFRAFPGRSSCHLGVHVSDNGLAVRAVAICDTYAAHHWCRCQVAMTIVIPRQGGGEELVMG